MTPEEQELLAQLKEITLPLRDTVEALFNGTAAYNELVQKSTVPLIIGMVSRTPYEEAVAGTYERRWMRSIRIVVVLDSQPRVVEFLHKNEIVLTLGQRVIGSQTLNATV